MPYNAAIAGLDMPQRIRALPVSPAGYPIPFFVCKNPLDFRVIQPGVMNACHKRKLCWICGGPLGKTFAFTVGPMCGINRTSSELPSHRECAEYSARACPFLSKPRMRRNDKDMPDGMIESAGYAIPRNPGVALIWVCRGYKPFTVPAGNGAAGGTLIEMGEPLELIWYAEGRPATRAEVTASVNSGLPLLQKACESERSERDRAMARVALSMRCAWLSERLPAEVPA